MSAAGGRAEERGVLLALVLVLVLVLALVLVLVLALVLRLSAWWCTLSE